MSMTMSTVRPRSRVTCCGVLARVSGRGGGPGVAMSTLSLPASQRVCGEVPRGCRAPPSLNDRPSSSMNLEAHVEIEVAEGNPDRLAAPAHVDQALPVGQQTAEGGDGARRVGMELRVEREARGADAYIRGAGRR